MVTVRNYKNTDLNAVNEILNEAFSCIKTDFNAEQFREIVAVSDDKVCGYLLLTKVLNPIKDKYYYLVDYVCVGSGYRGLGIGKKLLAYAEEIAKSEGVMYLQLTCGYQREAGQRLYNSCGFVKRESNIFRKELL